MNKESFVKETHPQCPPLRMLFDKNRKQVDGFPPSYFKQQLKTQPDTKIVVEEENVFIKSAQAFCSLILGNEFLCVGGK
ncbi:RNA_recognition motif-containing protein [Hexamita inflata]|uniref:RNA recognition motif-containing protein n=1 Tax=Hexamita inflata TaxID=28002 RepID=A0AA86NLW2_9EUKA|nr:RNA recognition motif-containing protein [Hexamita inflata]